MARRQSSWNELADDLAAWIETESDAIAGALTGDGPAPFAANLTSAERLQYFEAAMFNPDGSPNLSGRTQVMSRYGPTGYADVLRTVLAHHQRQQQPMMTRQSTMPVYPGIG